MGQIWKYGDDINTDVIYPGRYIQIMSSDKEMGERALCDLDETFTKQASPGDLIVAGKNWGCGSSREQAAKCLKVRGIEAIIAKSFARIFYRNAINEGLPVIVCPAAVDALQPGTTAHIDLSRGVIVGGEQEFAFAPYPDYIRQIVACGGLMPFIKKKLGANNPSKNLT